DVSIANSTLESLTLNYASSVVAGESDTLNLSVDNVSVGDGPTNVTVDAGIEALHVQVNAENDAASSLNLNAAGVTDITVTGGTAGQQLGLGINVNGG